MVLLVIHTTNLFSVLCERLGSLAVDYTPCIVDMAHSMLWQIINRPAEGINWDAESETFCYISVLASIFQYILLWKEILQRIKRQLTPVMSFLCNYLL